MALVIQLCSIQEMSEIGGSDHEKDAFTCFSTPFRALVQAASQYFRPASPAIRPNHTWARGASLSDFLIRKAWLVPGPTRKAAAAIMAACCEAWLGEVWLVFKMSETKC